ncbi:septin-5-like [Diretmus argenteus]
MDGVKDEGDGEDIGRKYVGVAALPMHIQRKRMKKGFEFTLMVVGESGLGKSTLVNTLLLIDLDMGRTIPSVVEKTVSIAKKTVSMKEQGVNLKLTIVDTPGFGDSIDNRECWKQVSDYIDQRFEQYRRDETSLNRTNLQDERVHCCLYFISPYGHGLMPLDVACMRALHQKVNIIPVIAKADSFTQKELALKKTRIRNEIEKYKINIYQIPDGDEDENPEMKAAVPFAVMGSNSVVDCNGRKIRTRSYPWGFIDVENSAHSDFGLLRKMLTMTTHMQDLKDTTHHTHYENYRVEVHRKTQCDN